jgi:hypothetical protein
MKNNVFKLKCGIIITFCTITTFFILAIGIIILSDLFVNSEFIKIYRNSDLEDSLYFMPNYSLSDIETDVPLGEIEQMSGVQEVVNYSTYYLKLHETNNDALKTW